MQRIYLSRYHELISNQKHRFVHWSLISFLTPNEKKDLPFQKLTVRDLEEMFRNDPECTFMGKGREVEYSREQNFNAFWLHTLWQFLKEEADSIMEDRWQGFVSDEDRRRLDALLQPLANWSIFPVIRRGKTSLFPLRRAPAAIDLGQGDINSHYVREIMRKIKLPSPDYVVLRDNHTGGRGSNPILLAKVLVASINNPAGVLRCFPGTIS